MCAGNQSNQLGNRTPAGGYKQISNGTGDQTNRAASLAESYEKEMSVALRWARIVASLHAVSRFLAFCNLVWASAVLSAFASNLFLLDFMFIACLLLLEGIRCASASFFISLPVRALAHLSQDPQHIIHDKDGRWPSAAHYARICMQILQLILISPSFVIPSIRIFTLPLNYDLNVHNLQNSLHIFYSLVALNSLINLACSTLAFGSLHKPSSEQSILRYYHRVLENAMSLGIVQADNFEFFSFAYTMLASEYRRNVQPEAVAKNHKKLIQYLYAHRLGVDFVQSYMDAEDAFVQLAAVNMVGFWTDTAWGVGLKEVKLPAFVQLAVVNMVGFWTDRAWGVGLKEERLTKLADKVGTGQVEWAATSSFGALVRRAEGACLVARTQTSSGCSLPERLAELVDATSSRSLCLVRTLVSFYEQLCVKEREAPKAFGKAGRELLEKLKKLARGARVQRLRVQAAYLLLMMGEDCDPSVIVAIDPTQDAYWFQSEVDMLHLLRKHIPYIHHAFPLQLQHLSIRKDANITPPLWAHPSH